MFCSSEDFNNVVRDLVHDVIRDVLRAPEAWLQVSGPEGVALPVLKLNCHLCIINRDTCAIAIHDSRIRVVVAEQPHCSRAAQDSIGLGRILDDNDRFQFGESQKQLVS